MSARIEIDGGTLASIDSAWWRTARSLRQQGIKDVL
jgi:hypothetical protein